jgi:hypothetical protein
MFPARLGVCAEASQMGYDFVIVMGVADANPLNLKRGERNV